MIEMEGIPVILIVLEMAWVNVDANLVRLLVNALWVLQIIRMFWTDLPS